MKEFFVYTLRPGEANWACSLYEFVNIILFQQIAIAVQLLRPMGFNSNSNNCGRAICGNMHTQGKTTFCAYYEYFGKMETFSVKFFLLNRMIRIPDEKLIPITLQIA